MRRLESAFRRYVLFDACQAAGFGELPNWLPCARNRGMLDRSLTLCRAIPGNIESIVRLIEDRADWLRTQKIDQWAQPWPNRTERDKRILAHIRAEKTWLIWDADTAVATITADRDADPYWPEPERQDPAVYIHRLVVSLPFAGLQLGSQLIDWAGRAATHDFGARWIRVSAWTTNERLHAYYSRVGFRRCERVIGNGHHPPYPSAALFERPAGRPMATGRTLFTEVPPDIR
jgi:GNAT superfamily N-acetyltransferase